MAPASTASCFLCNPIDDRPAETPWQWSRPRALCVSHKVGLRLADGRSFDDALERVTPPDAPLEGSLLGWIFSPVLLDLEDGSTIKGWPDFAGGGMAILEDRWAASSFFEFRALEVAGNVDALYALRMAAVAGVSMTTMADLVAVIMKASSERRQIDGLQDLAITRSFQVNLDRIRRSTETLFPESFANLEEWTNRCWTDPNPKEPSTERALVVALKALAACRFPNA